MQVLNKIKSKFKIWKITLVNIQITFSVENYKKFGKSYLIQNWNINNWNLDTIVHLFPFIIGFTQMLSSKVEKQPFSYLLENTIPAKKVEKENISWETFQFIKSKSLPSDHIKSIDIYNDSILIDIKEKIDQYPIGLIRSPQDFKVSTNSTNLQLSKNKYQLNLINFIGLSSLENRKTDLLLGNIYYKLDELPFKIEKIYELKSSNNSFFKNQLSKLENNEEKDFVANNSININKTLLLPSFFLNHSNVVNKKTCGIKVIKANNLDLNELNNKRKNTKETNFSKKYLLEKELNKLFYRAELLPIFIIPENQAPFDNQFYSSQQTLKIVQDFLPLQQFTNIFPKKISGYFYPDLKLNEIYSIALQKLIQPTQNPLSLKIALPASFLINNNDSFPSLLFDNLPITYRKDGFFGVKNDKTSIQINDETNNFTWKNSLVKEITKPENQTFENLDDSDPDGWFLMYEPTEKSKAINFEYDKLEHLVQTNVSKTSNSSKNSLISNFKNNQIKYHYHFFNENLVTTPVSTKLHIGESYKKIPTLSKLFNSNNFSFFQSWEPLSFYSWMVITQFSIGLLLLQLLKDLYKDYGKELVNYILQFANSSGIDIEEIKEQYLYEDRGYRLIKKIKKKFKDIAGIDNILPEVGELVWFLRNEGRSSKFKNTRPKGILLTGPPGTGKTLLVQAIAGEAQVPVIIESGTLLTDPQQKGRGIEKLKKIFQQARELAPCIIFIDEVDTIGEKRQNIIETAMGGDKIIESLYPNKFEKTSSSFIPHPLNLKEELGTEKDLEYQFFKNQNSQNTEESETSTQKTLGEAQQNQETKKTKLSLLTQFLIEMDGLKERQGVLVIAATNRPTVLDPALIRPGRFDKILKLDLPGKKKRIEILKLYSKNLKSDKQISWEYLANRTQGFSAADLAATMNESSIQAILQKTKHTIETIERGIEVVTSYTSEKNNSSIKTNDSFVITRLAYYQSGKALIKSLLALSNNELSLKNDNCDINSVVFYLWPRQKNTRYSNFYEKATYLNKSRLSLEGELISLYSGKAAEILAISGNKKLRSLKNWDSDFGVEDLLSASFLANQMIDNWFLYSNSLSTRKYNQLLNNRNITELKDIEKLSFLSICENQIDDEIEIDQVGKLFRTSGYQQRGFGPWWQIQVSKQLSEIESVFTEWYRIYLPDPEESILNLEWIPPDEFYHTNDSLKKLSENSNPSFNDLYKIDRDYIFQGLIFNSFNKAFSSLETKREFLDYFADYLLRYEILRHDQISFLLTNLNLKEKSETYFTSSETRNIDKNFTISSAPIERIKNNWGSKSRRKQFRFINLKKILK